MNALIVYDSYFGNTEKIANKIHEQLSAFASSEIKKVDSFSKNDLDGVDLIILGSPTRAFNPSPKVKVFLQNLPKAMDNAKKYLVFDTRMKVEEINNRFLTFMSKLFGYAAEKMSKKMNKKGYVQLTKPQWFFVADSEGPLKEGELEKAGEWVTNVVKSYTSTD